MTEKTLHEYFPDLSIMEFKMLGTIAYHGEIPGWFHFKTLAQKSRYQESDVKEALNKLRKSEYILEERVSPKYFFKVVDFIMKNIPQWENTFSRMQTFRYDFSAYLWELGKLISNEEWIKAVALRRPKASLQPERHVSMRMEKYLANIISNKENGILAKILIRDEVDALVTYQLEQLLRENRLSLEEIAGVEEMIDNADMCLYDYADQLDLYRYFVRGYIPPRKISDRKADTLWSLALRAIDRMYANDLTGAMEAFKSALREHDKLSRVKGSFDNRILSFFYAICILRCEVSSHLTSQTIVNQKVNFLHTRNVYYGRELAATRILLTYATSEHPNCDTYVKKEIATMIEEDNCPLTYIFADLLLAFFKCNKNDYSTLYTPSCGILKCELSGFLPIGVKDKESLQAAFRGKPQLAQIRRRDPWQIAFSDIRRNIMESKKAEKRIA